MYGNGAPEWSNHLEQSYRGGTQEHMSSKIGVKKKKKKINKLTRENEGTYKRTFFIFIVFVSRMHHIFFFPLHGHNLTKVVKGLF